MEMCKLTGVQKVHAILHLLNIQFHQMKIGSEIEKMNCRVTNVCDELRGHLELLKNSNQEGNNGKDENTSDVMPDNCRTDTSSGYASSTACIVTCNVNGHSNGGPQVKYVNEVGLGGSQQSYSLNNESSKERTGNNNNLGFVKGTLNDTLDLALPH
jgi:hypothetical protein